MNWGTFSSHHMWVWIRVILCILCILYIVKQNPVEWKWMPNGLKCAIYLAFLTNFGIPTSECDPRTSVVPPKSFNAVDSTGRNNQVSLPLPSPRMRSSFTESHNCCSSSFGTLSPPWPPLQLWLDWPLMAKKSQCLSPCLLDSMGKVELLPRMRICLIIN